MEMLLTEGMAKLYERMDELNSSQLLKLVQISANYVLPKVKPQLNCCSKGYNDMFWDINVKKPDYIVAE